MSNEKDWANLHPLQKLCEFLSLQECARIGVWMVCKGWYALPRNFGSIHFFKNSYEKIMVNMKASRINTKKLDCFGYCDIESLLIWDGLRNVRKLRLSVGTISIDQMVVLRNAKELRKLNIDCKSIDDSAMDALADFEFFEELILRNCCVTKNNMEGIGKIKSNSFTKLTFRRCEDIEDITDLTSLMYLEELNIGAYVMSDENLKILSECHMLHKLVVNELKNDGGDDGVSVVNGLRALGKLKYLETLKISGCAKLREDEIQVISGFVGLRTLGIKMCRNIGDKCIEILTNLHNLESLILWWNNISNKGLGVLDRFGKLREFDLNMHVGKENDDWEIVMKALGKLSKLETLRLRRCKFLRREIELLKETNLQKIYLLGCEGLTDEILGEIMGFPQLMNLSLNSCHLITEEGVRMLCGSCTLREVKIMNCNKIKIKNLNGKMCRISGSMLYLKE